MKALLWILTLIFAACIVAEGRDETDPKLHTGGIFGDVVVGVITASEPSDNNEQQSPTNNVTLGQVVAFVAMVGSALGGAIFIAYLLHRASFDYGRNCNTKGVDTHDNHR